MVLRGACAEAATIRKYISMHNHCICAYAGKWMLLLLVSSPFNTLIYQSYYLHIILWLCLTIFVIQVVLLSGQQQFNSWDEGMNPKCFDVERTVKVSNVKFSDRLLKIWMGSFSLNLYFHNNKTLLAHTNNFF